MTMFYIVETIVFHKAIIMIPVASYCLDYADILSIAGGMK
jgi:hypothetical protein